MGNACHRSFWNLLACNLLSENILSRVLVSNNAGPGLEERVYLLHIHTTSNHTIITLSLFIHFISHCYTHYSSPGNGIKTLSL
jgi:hypothetical protein